MNNKGFTLVELLAVMVILLSISVVAVTNVTASLNRTETAEKDSQKKIAINAAKIYFSLNSKDCADRDDLKSYLKDANIDKLDSTFCIKIGSTSYIYDDLCTCP